MSHTNAAAADAPASFSPRLGASRPTTVGRGIKTGVKAGVTADVTRDVKTGLATRRVNAMWVAARRVVNRPCAYQLTGSGDRA